MAGWSAAAGVLSSTANNTLPAGDYYYVGDIKIKHVISISGTVRFWCTGAVTDIVGTKIQSSATAGLAGGIGKPPTRLLLAKYNHWFGTLANTDGTGGGFIGKGGNGGNNNYIGVVLSHAGVGGAALHHVGVKVNVFGSNTDSTTKKFKTISGVPATLEGSGSGSGGAISYLFSVGKGADGVQGGVGFAIIARGINIQNTTIDLRGKNGLNGVAAGGVFSGQSGSGGGGGGTCVLAMENNGLGGSPVYSASKILVSGGTAGISVGYYKGKVPQPGGSGDLIVQGF